MDLQVVGLTEGCFNVYTLTNSAREDWQFQRLCDLSIEGTQELRFPHTDSTVKSENHYNKDIQGNSRPLSSWRPLVRMMISKACLA